MLIYLSNNNVLMLPNLIVLSMKLFIGIFSHNLSICILLTRSWTKTIRQKTFIGILWSVGKSVDNKFTDRFTDRQSAKKNLLISFHL